MQKELTAIVSICDGTVEVTTRYVFCRMMHLLMKEYGLEKIKEFVERQETYNRLGINSR